ncbi:MAG TPA: polyphenol oxidase family protein [Gemmatimonadales bacterium]|nr:polyphenol oxidase family protein [Gemmatimonadales bacterium]
MPSPIPRFEIPSWREQYGVIAGITGRGYDLGLWSDQPVGEVMSRWLEFRRAMRDFEAFALGNQIHGVEVSSLDGGRGWVYRDGVDGWTTITPGVLLSITVADCIPVYLVVPGRGVALLHAGWRGAAEGILKRGVDRLTAATRSSEGDVVMHCGVGICGDCYEVGREVLDGFGVQTTARGPWHLDIRDHLLKQAHDLGLWQTTASPLCSAHDRSAFYSHRASHGKDGRMVAYIGVPGLHP